MVTAPLLLAFLALLEANAAMPQAGEPPREARPYDGLKNDHVHEAINHSREYFRGRCHTQNADTFCMLLKRAIRGTYVSVEPWHLSRYLAEETFRLNEREGKDADRFETVLGNVTGKRLTHKQLIGEAEARAAS